MLWLPVVIFGGIVGGFWILLFSILFLLVTSICIFVLPHLMAGRGPGGTLPEQERFTSENEIRTALIQAVAGVALIATFVFGWRQLKATTDEVEIARKSAKDTQLSEQFSLAINELSKEETKLGGIATLEQTANEKSSDGRRRYYDHALRYLAAVIRSAPSDPPPVYRGDPDREALPSLEERRPEVQAAIESVSRLRANSLELGNADLIRARLHGAHLADAKLDHAKLVNADLSGANLRGANLSGADLRGADLSGADLSGADLRGAIADGQTDFPPDVDQKLDQKNVIRPLVNITSPSNDREKPVVPQQITVTGTYMNTTAGKESNFLKDAQIWVIVYIGTPGIRKVYPQSGTDLPFGAANEKATWSISNVGVGQEGDEGKPFDVVAVIADPQSDRELRKSPPAGLSELPVGAVEMDRVTVTRR